MEKETNLPQYRLDMTDDEMRQVFFERERILAENSYIAWPMYPKKYCSVCGRLMMANSLAYHEGWHFDSCE